MIYSNKDENSGELSSLAISTYRLTFSKSDRTILEESRDKRNDQ